MIAWTALFCQRDASLSFDDYILHGRLLWLVHLAEFLSAAVEPHVAPVPPRSPNRADGPGPSFLSERFGTGSLFIAKGTAPMFIDGRRCRSVPRASISESASMTHRRPRAGLPSKTGRVCRGVAR